ncbi:hypothetical protein C0Q70_13419 [Pomacea canaliculata]|uniref:Uncharacterized protein n=1 Tax=Pomacea canaliculata TaxID=400727 RepID=A0A2T7NX79_POMCA|nr:uncharacterized protein LOC112571362 [Pomacea canaliculata]PVD25759.1 hypothetical protein C0Q70_13419 [Pomacea canaliculata]
MLDDDAGIFYLGNDDDYSQDRHKIDLNKRSFGKFESNFELESKKEQPQKHISGTRDELEMRSPDSILLTNDDEDYETDRASDSHHFFPLKNLQNPTDVLDGVLLKARRASLNVSFQRTSLHRSQTCPTISTSTFVRPQVVAQCRAVDDSHASVVLPTGFSQMWFRAVSQTSVKNYGSSQEARRQRSYSFSHEKDVHYQQQQQQQHYLHQQMLQQQRTTMAGRRSMPKRDRSYSESDVRWLQHREMGRELRRMSDEFVYERSRRPLMTVREEDEDSSVGSHYSSSYPETVGTHHWF